MFDIPWNCPSFAFRRVPWLVLFLICLLFSFSLHSPGNRSIAHAAEYSAVSEEKDTGSLKPAATSSYQKRKDGNEEVNEDNNSVTSSSTLFNDIPGTGAFLGTVLHSLSLLSTDSEIRFRSMINHIPEVIPDLRKVFLTL